MSNNPGMFCCPRKEMLQNKMVGDTEASLKGLLLAKSGAIWPPKLIMTVMDYNQLSKIRIHESM